MFFIPTTMLTVSREDEGTDNYGDPVTTTTVALRAVPAHIYPRSLTAAEPSSGRLLIEQSLKAIVAGGWDIRTGDILEDDNGTIYTVNGIINHFNPFDKAHMELELEDIT